MSFFYKKLKTTNFVHEKLKPIVLFKDNIARCPYCRSLLTFINETNSFNCNCDKHFRIYRTVFPKSLEKELIIENKPLFKLSATFKINKTARIYVHIDYETDITILNFVGKNISECKIEATHSNFNIDNEIEFIKKMKLYLTFM